jgi:DNA-binding transcriptional regulator GbsR (MarR family)
MLYMIYLSTYSYKVYSRVSPYMTNETLLRDLEKIGLSRNVAKVYAVLIESQEMRAGEIVKKLGMHRHLVYTALDELESKKLISRTQKAGVARFTLLHPRHLLDEVKKTEQVAVHLIELVEQHKRKNTQEVIVYEGLDEILSVERRLYESISPTDTYCLLGLGRIWFDGTVSSQEIFELAAIQEARGFSIQAITNKLVPGEHLYAQKTKGRSEFKEMPGVASKDTEIGILSDRIFIRIYREPYTCIEIINTALAVDYRSYFDQLWNQ